MRTWRATAFLTLLLATLCLSAFADGPGNDRVLGIRFSGLDQKDPPTIGVRSRASSGGWKPDQLAAIFDPEHLFKTGQAKLFPECIQEQLRDNALGQLQIMPLDRYLRDAAMITNNKGQKEQMNIFEVVEMLRNSKAYTKRPVSMYLFNTDTMPPTTLTGLGMPDVFGGFEFDFNDLSPEFQMPGSQNIPKNVAGTLWVVAGQNLRSVEPGQTQAQVNLDYSGGLPWMALPQYGMTPADYIALRLKYRLMWEGGRGTGSAPGQFRQLLGNATSDLLHEIFYYGMRPTPELLGSSAITFECMTEDGYRAISKLFPEERFIYRRAKGGGPYEVVFLIPLKDLVERLPPEDFDIDQKLLKEAGIFANDPAAREQFKQYMPYLSNIPLDRGGDALPLQLNTVNSGMTRALPYIVGKSGAIQYGGVQNAKLSDAQLDQLGAARFQPRAGAADPFWPNQMVDPAFPFAIKGAAEGKKAIQVSNLDPRLAANDPDYVKASLVAAFDWYLRSLHPGMELKRYSPEAGQIANELATNGIQFMATTNYPKTAATIKKLGPVDSIAVSLAKNEPVQKYWHFFDRYAKNPAWAASQRESTEHGYVFSLYQILQFRDEIYKKAEETKTAVPSAYPGKFWWLAGVTSPN